jgi:hypothetical protein
MQIGIRECRTGLHGIQQACRDDVLSHKHEECSSNTKSPTLSCVAKANRFYIILYNLHYITSVVRPTRKYAQILRYEAIVPQYIDVELCSVSIIRD